jgi:hypothetical protein
LNFRWPYQAKVMNTFEMVNSKTVCIAMQHSAPEIGAP